MATTNLSIQDALRTERRRLLENEWHERSLDRTGTGHTTEMDIVTAQLDGVVFDVDMMEHEELCRCMDCEISKNDAEMLRADLEADRRSREL